MRYVCPEYDFTCPYLKRNGECTIGDDGYDPMEQCDVYAYYNYDGEDEDAPDILVLTPDELICLV